MKRDHFKWKAKIRENMKEWVEKDQELEDYFRPTYGRSPGMDSLPDIQALNHMEKLSEGAVKHRIPFPFPPAPKISWWKKFLCRWLGHKWKVYFGVDPAKGSDMEGFSIRYCDRCLCVEPNHD